LIEVVAFTKKGVHFDNKLGAWKTHGFFGC
jgi:hypothetical protein